jgi:hypothetical protein
MFENKEYFYCYSTNLFKFMKMEKQINYLCSGLHEKTLRQFWQFKRDEAVNAALLEYTQRGIDMGVIKV